MIVRRHRLPVRLWHWTNAVAVFVLLMSGLMIFNAHPRLYWGAYGANPDPAWLEIYATRTSGVLRIGDLHVETTGVLGRWTDSEGVSRARAFPYWATIPSTYSLALARRWHIAFAWVLAVAGSLYLIWTVAGRHTAALLPGRQELAPRRLWQDIKAHARLRLPHGEAAIGYNPLQKLAYAGVVFALLPAMVLSGLAMSPAMDAAWPWLVDLFGGRQSARSVHFISAMLIAAFIAVHLLMVLLSGPLNGIGSMITGRYRIPDDTP